MKLSNLGEKLTKKTGILELMDDLGTAVSSKDHYYMLGGGNPAAIPEINRLWRRRMEEILADGDSFEKMVTYYDSPRGRNSFLEATADFFRREYGWKITEKNVAVTNSSQTAFMMLFNMFAGADSCGACRKILFPLLPEYVGYSDQFIAEDCIRAIPARIEEYDDRTFKYRVDFERIEIDNGIAAVCVSRPTNPSGNVLTDGEIEKLSTLTKKRNIPLLIDNAYGTPFPNILFVDAEPYWDDHIIYSMSLSKLGLPSTRTGIIIANEEIIDALSAFNAVVSLASGSLGQVLTEPFIRSGEIIAVSRDLIKPFYRAKSQRAQEWVHETMAGQDYALHRSEGAIFLWLWMKNLSIPATELYSVLKRHRVLIIPGKHFFYGYSGPYWEHSDQCIRINYSQDDEDVRRGIEIIARETERYSH
jgi:valine--pyruvate aminotransferase